MTTLRIAHERMDEELILLMRSRDRAEHGSRKSSGLRQLFEGVTLAQELVGLTLEETYFERKHGGNGVEESAFARAHGRIREAMVYERHRTRLKGISGVMAGHVEKGLERASDILDSTREEHRRSLHETERGRDYFVIGTQMGDALGHFHLKRVVWSESAISEHMNRGNKSVRHAFVIHEVYLLGKGRSLESFKTRAPEGEECPPPEKAEEKTDE